MNLNGPSDKGNVMPMYKGSADTLLTGFSSLESAYGVTAHPLKKIVGSFTDAQHSDKLNETRRIYGSHMAMRLATEKAVFGRPRRMVGLESSSIGRDTLLGEDLQIGFENFLDQPKNREDLPKLTIHSQMEAKLGIL